LGYPDFHDDLPFDSLVEAIERNLVYLNRLNPESAFRYGPDTYTCREVRRGQEAFLAMLREGPDPERLGRWIREHYRLYKASGRPGNPSVLFTGYFEPLYEGSLRKDEIFLYPIYGVPGDLLTIDLSPFSPELEGRKVVARLDGKSVVPYYSRSQIDGEGALNNRGLEIAWLKDPVDIAFLQIQGSGRLLLQNGKSLAVGYAAANGRPYRSIGGYLVKNGLISSDQLTMESIRKYLSQNPARVEEVLNYNPSYVFFRVLENGPVGNINVPVTPGRTLALDSKLFPRGALAFMCSEKPVLNDQGEITRWEKFCRFVLNQDTGGAIKGAGRADLFWGSGLYAEVAAGHLKHEGELYILVPKIPTP
jgi:membrane-bound lytic murein transglycosylase A